MTGLIAEILNERASCHRSHNPIIFIGHSFGGNLLKQIFAATHPSCAQQAEYRQLYQCLRGYVYFGAPHKPVYFPDISALWRTLESQCDSTLRGGSSDLQRAIPSVARINDDFREFGGEDLPSLCFYETVKTRVGLSEVSRLLPG